MLLGGAARLLPRRPSGAAARRNSCSVDRRLLEACNQLVWAGYRFAIGGQHPRQLPEELLRLAEIVKVDVATHRPDAAAATSPTWLRGYHVRLLAMHARHRPERDTCQKFGFELFEGYRFTAPETLSRRDLPIEHVLTFRLLKLVRDPNTRDAEIEDMLRRDVALSYKLLRMVNSAAVGGRDIWSIGHALRLLGRDQVARWLGLLLVTDGKSDGVRAELMTVSLVRARMCELLADASGIPRARGPLFLVGMLSVLDQMLETPMDMLADSMELAPDIRAMRCCTGRTSTAMCSSLIEAYEQGWWDQVDALAAVVGVSPVALSSLYIDALTWATEHQRRNRTTPSTARQSPALAESSDAGAAPDSDLANERAP